MTKKEVVVNIGYKSDGIIALTEFRYNPDIKVGDSVEVFIENKEDMIQGLLNTGRNTNLTSIPLVGRFIDYLTLDDKSQFDVKNRKYAFPTKVI